MKFQGCFSAKNDGQYGTIEAEEEDEEGSLPVGFLDFILGGSGFYAEGIVELCFCYHF